MVVETFSAYYDFAERFWVAGIAAPKVPQVYHQYMYHSLNPLKGCYIKDYIGDY